MEKAIDKAVKKTRERDFQEEDENKKKKHKKTHEKSKKKPEEEDEDMEQEDETPPMDLKRYEIAKKELRNLCMRYKNVNVKDIEEIQKSIEKIHPKEIENALENMKAAIGISSPDHTAKAIVGTIGLFLQRFLKEPSIHARLMNDARLLAIMEYVTPCLGDYLTLPLQAFHSIAGHVSDVQFGVKPKLVDTMD